MTTPQICILVVWLLGIPFGMWLFNYQLDWNMHEGETIAIGILHILWPLSFIFGVCFWLVFVVCPRLFEEQKGKPCQKQ